MVLVDRCEEATPLSRAPSAYDHRSPIEDTGYDWRAAWQL